MLPVFHHSHVFKHAKPTRCQLKPDLAHLLSPKLTVPRRYFRLLCGVATVTPVIALSICQSTWPSGGAGPEKAFVHTMFLISAPLGST